jgi:hypothetical protein
MLEAGATHVDTATKLARAQDHIRGNIRLNWDPVLGVDCAAAGNYALHFVSHSESVRLLRCVVGKLSRAVSELLGAPASARR